MVAKSPGKNETGCGRNAQRYFSALSTVKQSCQYVYIIKSEQYFIFLYKTWLVIIMTLVFLAAFKANEFYYYLGLQKRERKIWTFRKT